MLMLGRILGVPDVDLDFLVEKGDALIGNSDPDFTAHVVDRLDGDAYRMMPFRSPARAGSLRLCRRGAGRPQAGCARGRAGRA